MQLSEQERNEVREAVAYFEAELAAAEQWDHTPKNK